jgi:hypothetical protein
MRTDTTIALRLPTGTWPWTPVADLGIRRRWQRLRSRLPVEPLADWESPRARFDRLHAEHHRHPLGLV